jgi:hypothetical protein
VGWPSPPGGPCACPPLAMAYPNPPPLLLSFSTLHHSFRLVSLSAAPPLSFSGCAPLLPSLWCCSAPLPRYPSRSTATVVPFQIEQMVAESSRGRRGGGGIEQRMARRRRKRAEDSEEAAESMRRRWNRGSVSLSIRRQGAALPLRRAWSAPTPKRHLSND